MNVIVDVNEYKFSLNGVEYLKNFLSKPSGNKIEIYNCYERPDVLVPYTDYTQFQVNGVIHGSVTALQTALLPVLYNRDSLGGSLIDQNNVLRTISVGYITEDNALLEVLTKLNSMSFVITPIQTPVIITGLRVVNGVILYKLNYEFKPGKGTYGTGAAQITAYDLNTRANVSITGSDITDQENTIIIPLGDLPTGDYLTAANSETRYLDNSSKVYFFNYTQDGVSYLVQFVGNYGVYFGNLVETDFFPTWDDSQEPGANNLQLVTDIGSTTTNKIKIKNASDNSLIEYGYKTISRRKGANSTQVIFEDPTDTIQLTIPAKPINDTFAMISDIDGMTIEANQAAAELYLKNSSGDILATINIGFLNNEGTTFYYNASSGMLELKDDEGNVLSSVPVSAFVSNLIQSVAFNGSTPYILEFKDAENNVVDSVSFGVSNIQGLQALLDSKFNNPEGTTAQYIRGNGSLNLFANEVRASTLTGLSTSSQATITGSDDVLSAFGKLQAQLNNSLLIRLIIPASTDLNTFVETGVYNQTLNTNAASGSNYPVPLAGTLEVVRISSTLICQRYHVVGGGGSADNLIYTRIYASSVWGPWKRLITSLDTSVANWDAVYTDRVNYLRNQADGTLGSYLGSSGASIADLNNLITGMAWLIGSTLNLPNTSSHHVIALGGTSAYQTQLALRGSNFFFRSKEASVWQAWKRLWHDGDFTSGNIANWNTAFGWGDYRQFGLGATGTINISDANNQNLAGGLYTTSTSTANIPIAGSSGSLLNIRSGVAGGAVGQIWIRSNNATGDDIYVRHCDNAGTFTTWKRIWHNGDFTSTDIANWNSIFAASGNYVTTNTAQTISGLKTFGTNTPRFQTGLLLGSGVASIHYDQRGYYNYSNGLLIQTDIPPISSTMIELYITGNGYGGLPIDTIVTVYAYNSTSPYINQKNLAKGIRFDVDVFTYNGFVCFWIPQPSGFSNVRFKLGIQTASNRFITSVTNVVKPTSGVTDSITIQAVSQWNSNDFTSANIANWNSAFGWGDFRTYGHGTGVTNNPLVSADVLEFNTTGVFRVASSAPSLPVAENGYLYRIYRSASTRYILFYSDSGRVYKNVMNSSTWSGWKYFWDSGDFSNSSIANWNSAYDHSQIVGNPHNTQIADISGLQANLDSKANIASPNFTGVPTVPNAADGNNTTQVASTAFVQSAVTTVKRPYRSYTALISQTGTNVPSVTILENNLGFTPTWTYVSTGVFRLNSVGNFPEGRCVVFSNIGLPYSASNSYEIRWSRTTSPDYLQINTVEKSGSANAVNANNVLNTASIEVRIYDEL